MKGTYPRRGIHGRNMHTEGLQHEGDIHTEGQPREGDTRTERHTHGGDIHRGKIYMKKQYEGTYKWRDIYRRDMHMTGHTHGGKIHGEDMHMKGHTPGRDIHTEGNAHEGTYTLRDIHRLGHSYKEETYTRRSICCKRLEDDPHTRQSC